MISKILTACLLFALTAMAAEPKKVTASVRDCNFTNISISFPEPIELNAAAELRRIPGVEKVVVSKEEIAIALKQVSSKDSDATGILSAAKKILVAKAKTRGVTLNFPEKKDDNGYTMGCIETVLLTGKF